MGAPLGFLLVEASPERFFKLRSNGRSIALLMALCLVVPHLFLPPTALVRSTGFRQRKKFSSFPSNGNWSQPIFLHTWVDTNGIWHDNFATPKKHLDLGICKEAGSSAPPEWAGFKKTIPVRTSSFYEITYSLGPNGHKLSRRYPIAPMTFPLLEQIYCEPEVIQKQRTGLFLSARAARAGDPLYNAIGSRIGTVDTDQYEALFRQFANLMTMAADRLFDYSADSLLRFTWNLVSRNTMKVFGKNLELREQLQKHFALWKLNLILRSSYQKTLNCWSRFGLNLGQAAFHQGSISGCDNANHGGH